MVKCLPEFEYFTVFLKNNNIIFKIRRSKVTDYAALSCYTYFLLDSIHDGLYYYCVISIYTCSSFEPIVRKRHLELGDNSLDICALRMFRNFNFSNYNTE